MNSLCVCDAYGMCPQGCPHCDVCGGSDWELVTDAETAGVIADKTERPLRSHPYAPMGQVIAINKAAFRW